MVTLGTYEFFYDYKGKTRAANVSKFAYNGKVYYDLLFKTGNRRFTCTGGKWKQESGDPVAEELLRAILLGIDSVDNKNSYGRINGG